MLISVRKRAKVFVEPFGAILFLGNLCPHKRETIGFRFRVSLKLQSW
jgi:hypothetical protein